MIRQRQLEKMLSEYFSRLGKIGGSSKSLKKAQAARINGRKPKSKKGKSNETSK